MFVFVSLRQTHYLSQAGLKLCILCWPWIWVYFLSVPIARIIGLYKQDQCEKENPWMRRKHSLLLKWHTIFLSSLLIQLLSLTLNHICFFLNFDLKFLMQLFKRHKLWSVILMFLILITEFEVYACIRFFFLMIFFLLSMLKVLIINKCLRNWFQVSMCFVEGFHDRPILYKCIFQSIESGSNPVVRLNSAFLLGGR